ncbi:MULTISPECIES: hypothetical protein [Rhizobium]|uniref:hypothetical protein n=1 Tax=Rhizobium TaxID=379 RepID=UPI002360930D|nr:hypothetical protein [Rhizobium sp. MC62]MDC9812034.1 hypothetical protein [Rhizobium sp. MC62]
MDILTIRPAGCVIHPVENSLEKSPKSFEAQTDEDVTLGAPARCNRARHSALNTAARKLRDHCALLQRLTFRRAIRIEPRNLDTADLPCFGFHRRRTDRKGT